MSQYALGQYREAIATLEPVLPTLDALCAISYAVEFEFDRALARYTLARSLWAVRRKGHDSDIARIRELLASAGSFYRSAGAGYAWRVDEMAAWRAATLDRTSPSLNAPPSP